MEVAIYGLAALTIFNLKYRWFRWRNRSRTCVCVTTGTERGCSGSHLLQNRACEPASGHCFVRDGGGYPRTSPSTRSLGRRCSARLRKPRISATYLEGDVACPGPVHAPMPCPGRTWLVECVVAPRRYDIGMARKPRSYPNYVTAEEARELVAAFPCHRSGWRCGLCSGRAHGYLCACLSTPRTSG